MEELINKAVVFLDKKYIAPVHTVAAALLTASGKVYLGTNIDHFSGYVCAETSALATAMNAGEIHFVKLAAVRREKDGSIAVANACGKCRQILHDYAPNIVLAINDNGKNITRTVEEILPYSFQRQKEKIQQALASINTEKMDR